jgi:hypothetical protein
VFAGESNGDRALVRKCPGSVVANLPASRRDKIWKMIEHTLYIDMKKVI